jgi:hypothetical protein
MSKSAFIVLDHIHVDQQQLTKLPPESATLTLFIYLLAMSYKGIVGTHTPSEWV